VPSTGIGAEVEGGVEAVGPHEQSARTIINKRLRLATDQDIVSLPNLRMNLNVIQLRFSVKYRARAYPQHV
jgi:hypothetical protein